MKAILEKIKLIWGKFVKLGNNKNFIFGFPLAVFALLVLLKQSLLAGLALIVWILTIFVNTNEEG